MYVLVVVATMSDSRIDPVDEIELDSLFWESIHDARDLFLIEIRVFVAVVIDDFNYTIVDRSANQGRVHDLCVARSTHSYLSVPLELSSRESRDGHLAKLVIDVQRAYPVAHLSSPLVTKWRVREGRIKTVQVPVRTALVACDNLPATHRRAGAVIAEDNLSFGILGFEVVWQLVVTSTAPMEQSVDPQSQQ